MFDTSSAVRRADSVISCKIDDEVAILDLRSSTYYGLQGVGAHIWEALEHPRSVAELCEAIVAEFDVSPADCKKDVLEFLASIHEARLIETGRESAS